MCLSASAHLHPRGLFLLARWQWANNLLLLPVGCSFTFFSKGWTPFRACPSSSILPWPKLSLTVLLKSSQLVFQNGLRIPYFKLPSFKLLCGIHHPSGPKLTEELIVKRRGWGIWTLGTSLLRGWEEELRWDSVRQVAKEGGKSKEHGIVAKWKILTKHKALDRILRRMST